METKKEIGKGVFVNNETKRIGFFVGNFPKELAQEWDKDCKERYNDCRWLKIWSDHLVATTLTTNVILAEPEPEKEPEQEKKDDVQCIGQTKEDKK